MNLVRRLFGEKRIELKLAIHPIALSFKCYYCNEFFSFVPTNDYPIKKVACRHCNGQVS